MGLRITCAVLLVLAVAACGEVKPTFQDASIDGDMTDAAVDCNLRACSQTVDSCCPSGCNATNDIDCAAVCGNGTLEPGEHCDPLGNCPTDCPQQGCNLFTLVQPGTCFAECLANGQQTACVNGDSCCPGGCNANNDSDCQPSCGNGVVEMGEFCDPVSSCPTSCPQLGCQLRSLSGTGCAAHCVNGGMQTQCVNSDGCCPSGCNANNDNDCQPGCGNGVVEAGETCDPLNTCPQSCPQQGCTLRTLQNGGTCMAQCAATGTQTTCINNDGCCPTGCNANNDNDCHPTCGNNVVEAGETCDGNCPVCQETQTCYTQTGSAATCNVTCHVPVTTCGINGDSCCAFDVSSGGCNSTNDAECSGPRWNVRQFPTVNYSQCVNVNLYPTIDPFGSYDFTFCQPPGGVVPTGDPVITAVVDDLGNTYNVTNDDCFDTTALPRLAGWNCNNDQGIVRMSCASMSPGGFKPRGAISRLTLTVCPFGGTAVGSAPLWVWYNGRNIPNPG